MYERVFPTYKTSEKYINFPLLVETKDGDTFNGNLLKIDTFLNLLLERVVITTKNGSFFFESKNVYLKGENIKYIRFP